MVRLRRGNSPIRFIFPLQSSKRFKVSSSVWNESLSLLDNWWNDLSQNHRTSLTQQQFHLLHCLNGTHIEMTVILVLVVLKLCG
jgi:hypothetical protein